MYMDGTHMCCVEFVLCVHVHGECVCVCEHVCVGEKPQVSYVHWDVYQ